MKIKAATKALYLTIALLAFGVVGWFLVVKDINVSLPLALFYLTLVINTHFSVRLFADIIPHDHGPNKAVDALLVFSFFLMALHFHNPQYFAFFNLLLFILATIKYTLQLGVIPHPKLLRKKILMDLLGCIMCTLAFAGILLGYVAISSWALTIVFAIANVLLFFVWPLYVLTADSNLNS